MDLNMNEITSQLKEDHPQLAKQEQAKRNKKAKQEKNHQVQLRKAHNEEIQQREREEIQDERKRRQQAKQSQKKRQDLKKQQEINKKTAKARKAKIKKPKVTYDKSDYKVMKIRKKRCYRKAIPLQSLRYLSNMMRPQTINSKHKGTVTLYNHIPTSQSQSQILRLRINGDFFNMMAHRLMSTYFINKRETPTKSKIAEIAMTLGVFKNDERDAILDGLASPGKEVSIKIGKEIQNDIHSRSADEILRDQDNRQKHILQNQDKLLKHQKKIINNQILIDAILANMYKGDLPKDRSIKRLADFLSSSNSRELVQELRRIVPKVLNNKDEHYIKNRIDNQNANRSIRQH